MKDCVVKTPKEKYNVISGSIKIKDEGYFFNNLWDIMEDKIVKGKIYGISKMDADCFFTDESTSFAFFLPVDKTYMI